MRLSSRSVEIGGADKNSASGKFKRSLRLSALCFGSVNREVGAEGTYSKAPSLAEAAGAHHPAPRATSRWVQLCKGIMDQRKKYL